MDYHRKFVEELLDESERSELRMEALDNSLQICWDFAPKLGKEGALSKDSTSQGILGSRTTEQGFKVQHFDCIKRNKNLFRSSFSKISKDSLPKQALTRLAKAESIDISQRPATNNSNGGKNNTSSFSRPQVSFPNSNDCCVLTRSEGVPSCLVNSNKEATSVNPAQHKSFMKFKRAISLKERNTHWEPLSSIARPPQEQLSGKRIFGKWIDLSAEMTCSLAKHHNREKVIVNKTDITFEGSGLRTISELTLQYQHAGFRHSFVKLKNQFGNRKNASFDKLQANQSTIGLLKNKQELSFHNTNISFRPVKSQQQSRPLSRSGILKQQAPLPSRSSLIEQHESKVIRERREIRDIVKKFYQTKQPTSVEGTKLVHRKL